MEVLANYGGKSIAVHKCIKSRHYTLETYTILHVNYLSIKKKKTLENLVGHELRTPEDFAFCSVC